MRNFLGKMEKRREKEIRDADIIIYNLYVNHFLIYFKIANFVTKY